MGEGRYREPYDSTQSPATLPDHLDRIAQRDYCSVNEGYWIARDAATTLRGQGALLRDLIRETMEVPHETRDDGQILFIVRRLLGPGAQQAYLDDARRYCPTPAPALRDEGDAG